MATARFYYRDPAAPQPNLPVHVGVAAFVEHEGKVLMERRSDSGLWALIGGGMKSHESLEEGLRREIREETGLAVQSWQFFGVFSDPSRICAYPDGNVYRSITHVYRVVPEPFTELVKSDESTALQFFSPDELHSLEIPATHRHIVELYLQNPDGFHVQ
jgi:ADP-ribose pyrophosphatase YjhB (NUDIX family)